MRLKASIDNIADFFEREFADIQHQSSWDNSGKQVYLGDKPVTKLCLALDSTQSVINQAIDGGCELLITHHPLFFKAHKGLNKAILQESLAIQAIKNNLNILSYHTNLDMAAAGLSAYIVQLLGADLGAVLDIEGEPPDTYGFGRIGRFAEPMSFEDFVNRLKVQLGLRYVSTNMPEYAASIKNFAVVTGSGASSWKTCLQKGVQLLITGDMKHHDALDASEAGICIIDAGHFATEKIFMNHLADILRQRFELEIIMAQEGAAISII